MIGFICLGFSPKVSEKIVKKTKEIVKYEFNAKVYDANNGNYDDADIERTVKKALRECWKTFFFIDANNDEGNLSRSFEIGVKTMYEEAEFPAFVVINFEDMSLDELYEYGNIVGNILYNNGWVKYNKKVRYDLVFFSLKKGIAFDNPPIWYDFATDAEDYIDLFRDNVKGLSS